MPRKTMAAVTLPPVQPDCCADCPLCGVMPKEGLERNDRNNRVCLGMMKRLGGRFTKVRASMRDAKHPLHRPCDCVWEAWMELPGRRFAVSNAAYLRYLLPMHMRRQVVLDSMFD